MRNVDFCIYYSNICAGMNETRGCMSWKTMTNRIFSELLKDDSLGCEMWMETIEPPYFLTFPTGILTHITGYDESVSSDSRVIIVIHNTIFHIIFPSYTQHLPKKLIRTSDLVHFLPQQHTAESCCDKPPTNNRLLFIYSSHTSKQAIHNSFFIIYIHTLYDVIPLQKRSWLLYWLDLIFFGERKKIVSRQYLLTGNCNAPVPLKSFPF